MLQRTTNRTAGGFADIQSSLMPSNHEVSAVQSFASSFLLMFINIALVFVLASFVISVLADGFVAIKSETALDSKRVMVQLGDVKVCVPCYLRRLGPQDSFVCAVLSHDTCAMSASIIF